MYGIVYFAVCSPPDPRLRRGARLASRRVRTLTFLFADVRDYTGFLERHGDLAATVLIADYQRIVRAEVARAKGAEVKTEGDSFFVVFEAATDAVSCGAALLREAELYSRDRPDRPMRVGVGIHSGEPQPHEGQYVGGAVVVAARLAQQADAGELLVTEVVRALIPRDVAPAMRERSGLRLKGIAEPVRAYSVEWSSANAEPGPTILGRDEELAELSRVLADPPTRLVTIIGPGGVGKTRLATVAAERAAARSEGMRFVDLSTVRDPALVPAAVADALEVLESRSRTLARAIVAALRDRELILVLDNFEQVLEAAEFVSVLHAECPRLRVIVTSRQPLRIRHERVFVLAPLASDPATTLFIERARSAGARVTDPEIAARICRRLDGLPLAIELAAARCRHLPPRALLGRLDRALPLLELGPRDGPARQRTLTAAIGWSYDLLDERERAVFRRASVFSGGLTAEAAAAVCAIDGPGATAMLGPLTLLVDHSLLAADTEGADGEPRFRMLETIREFGSDRLRESGEEHAARARHARYYETLVERAAPRLERADLSIWLSRLTRDRANVSSTLAWAVESGEIERALRLASDLWPFWFMRGALTEGRERIEALLAVDAGHVDPAVRAAALNAAGALARYQRDYAAAESLVAEALAIRRSVDDAKAIADSLNNLGYITLNRGDHARARALYEEALGTYRARGDLQGIADAQSHLSLIALQHRELAEALSAEDESLRIWRELGDLQGVAWALHGRGCIGLEAGDLEAATRDFREGLEIARTLGHGWAIALLIDGVASAAAAAGHPQRALRLAGAAAAIRKRAGTPLAPMHERLLHRWLERARHALRPGPAAERYAGGGALADEEAITEALAGEDAPLAPAVPDEHWAVLSEREREVAALVAQGLTNRQIAERLFIAPGTADRHVANILGKLDMRNRAQVAAWVTERGLLQHA